MTPEYEPLKPKTHFMEWIKLPPNGSGIARSNANPELASVLGIEIDTSEPGISITLHLKDAWGSPHILDKLYYPDRVIDLELLGIATCINLSKDPNRY